MTANLVEADMRGVTSHGHWLLRRYSGWLDEGEMNPQAQRPRCARNSRHGAGGRGFRTGSRGRGADHAGRNQEGTRGGHRDRDHAPQPALSARRRTLP